ncbi:Hypp2872 [Branchiostoma lanceolatum]|uniref:Hypp2872 protein n=1 Tax=Branchiostoma lanceolatum TaxID=7740 RepID=A0A8K0EVD6_BRALA|nr:Hypp2872 [Branchiostoma lanceolatum]
MLHKVRQVHADTMPNMTKLAAAIAVIPVSTADLRSYSHVVVHAGTNDLTELDDEHDIVTIEKEAKRLCTIFKDEHPKDNDPNHRSKYTRSYLQNHSVNWFRQLPYRRPESPVRSRPVTVRVSYMRMRPA